jgi:hypothetical protein
MEDTKVNKRFMVELSTWWLRVKSSEKDEILSHMPISQKQNVKPGIHENTV